MGFWNVKRYTVIPITTVEKGAITLMKYILACICYEMYSILWNVCDIYIY